MDWDTQFEMLILGASKRYRPGPHGLLTEDGGSDDGLQIESGGDNSHLVKEDDPG